MYFKIFGKIRWPMGSRPCWAMRNNVLVHFDVRIINICYFGSLEAAAVSGDSGDRVSESTPRAAATTREARTPTAAQYRITAEYWKPSRGLRTSCVGQTAAAACFFFFV